MLTIISKADLLEPKPANWDAVEQEESEWDGEGEPELSMLEGMDGFSSMSTLEQVGVTSVRLELIRQCLAVRIDDPMQLPSGWYRRDLQ